MKLKHSPRSDITVNASETPEKLTEPTDAEQRALLNGTIDVNQLITRTTADTEHHSVKLGAKGIRSHFTLTKLARSFAAIGAILHVVRYILERLLEPFQREGYHSALVALFSPDGGLEFPYSSSIQPVSNFPFDKFFDGFSAVLESNKSLGLDSEICIDVTGFKANAGKGKVRRTVQHRMQLKLTKKTSRNMEQFRRSKQGCFDTYDFLYRLPNSIRFKNACFGLCLAVALYFKRKAAIQEFKRHIARYAKKTFETLADLCIDIYRKADVEMETAVSQFQYEKFARFLSLYHDKRLVIYAYQDGCKLRKIYPDKSITLVGRKESNEIILIKSEQQ